MSQLLGDGCKHTLQYGPENLPASNFETFKTDCAFEVYATSIYFFIQLLLLFLVLVYFSSYSYSPLFVLILSFTFFSFCHILNVDILSFCFFFSISKGLLQVFKCYIDIDIVCCVVTYHTDMCECLLSIIFSAIWKWTCVNTTVRFPGKKN